MNFPAPGWSAITTLVPGPSDDGFQRVYKQTVGLDFFEKLVTIRGTRRLKLQVWDIGGQSVGSRMLPKYIYGAHVIFLCYDVTDPQSFRDLEDWLRLARRVVGGGPGVCGAPAPPPSLAGRPRAKLYAVGNKVEGRNEYYMTCSLVPFVMTWPSSLVMQFNLDVAQRLFDPK